MVSLELVAAYCEHHLALWQRTCGLLPIVAGCRIPVAGPEGAGKSSDKPLNVIPLGRACKFINFPLRFIELPGILGGLFRVAGLTVQQGKQTFIRGLHNLGSFQGQSVVTIGSFDGVHVGHRAILRQVRQKASELGIQSIAMTFEPQPREYFSAEKAPARLMRLREKVEALWEIGIDCVVCLIGCLAFRAVAVTRIRIFNKSVSPIIGSRGWQCTVDL